MTHNEVLVIDHIIEFEFHSFYYSAETRRASSPSRPG